MPVLAEDIRFYGSGASNLGGTNTGVEVTFAILFDKVLPAEAVAGAVEYRCVYVRNTNGSSPMPNGKFWVVADTVALNTSIEIGLGSSIVDGTEQTVANETTAPVGVSFSAPTSQGTGLDIPDLPAGSHKAIWFKRIIGAGAASGPESITFEISGDDS